MKLLSEFKAFAMRGNVVDLAVGIIIGASFGKIVSSAVTDVLMPPLGLAVGGLDFKDIKIHLKEAVGTKPAVDINIGLFLNQVIDFVIVAFAIFMMIKIMNSLQRKKEEKPNTPPPPPAQEVLLAEIRDLLKKGR